MDAEKRYCGRCHVFVDQAPAIWVVWSFEHDAWWGPHRWGYTPDLAEAGHYTQLEAEAIERQANVVALHECAMPWIEARRSGPP